jgi:hypothetical protein
LRTALPAAIVLLAWLLRVWNPGAAQYGPDEVTLTSLAYGVASGRHFPLGVNASVAVPHGPVAPYLLAPFAAVSVEQPVLLAGIAGINVLSVALFYRLATSLFGRLPGLAAAALYAANPWLVVFGRWLENNALIAPTAVLMLWTIYRAVGRDRVRYWGLVGTATAVSLQVHLSSLANGIAVLGLAAQAPTPTRRRGLLVGGVTAGVLLAPWLIGAVRPVLLQGGFGAGTPGEWSTQSVVQAARLVTGQAYRSIVDAPLAMIDTTGWPFALIDAAAVALAAVGLVRLAALGWRRRGATAATSLVALLMVVAPVAVLARPPRIGNVADVYAHELINVVPPLLLGMASLVALGPRWWRRMAAALCFVVAAAQALSAVPFHLTPIEAWTPREFSLPYGRIEPLLHVLRERAVARDLPVMVGGEEFAEQGKLPQTALRVDYARTRLHDGRDGLVLWDAPDVKRQVLVSTRDEHSMARFLLSTFPSAELFAQDLTGTRWTRRVFEVPTSELHGWAETHLGQVPAAERPSRLQYERGGLVSALSAGGPPLLAVLWGFAAEPSEPFFTDVILVDGRQEVHRERHVAYPAAFWEPGDWQRLRMLNLFDLPASVDLDRVDGVRLEHPGILSGRPVAPPQTFPVHGLGAAAP